jgi:hypothetical protein
MRVTHLLSRPPRQGIILLVVVLMLSLFLVVGLAFVFYSQSAAEGSRITKEATTPDQVDVPPETLLSWGLGQLIYPVPDDMSGALSAMRGHELARSMYGWHAVMVSGTLQVEPNHTNNAWDQTLDPTAPSVTYGNYANTTPFNGFGPLRAGVAFLPGVATVMGVSEYDLVNYTYFNIDGFVRDPERPATTSNAYRADPTQVVLPKFAGGFNVSYTYPDRANMAVAAVQANNGMPILRAQSFFRPNIMFPSLDPTNPNWTNPSTLGRYLVLRPRPADQLLAGETLTQTANGWIAQKAGGVIRPAFPPPADAGGDVKQLPSVLYFVNVNGQMVQVQNDSFWMDLAYPVQLSRNGRKFKPLFAFQVLPLDGRLNVNAVGNLNAVATVNGTQILAHASNQGLGRHEINISKILPNPSLSPQLPPNTPEWTQLYAGAVFPPLPNMFPGAVTPTYIAGRYGVDMTPGNATLAMSNAIADPYAPDLLNNSKSFRSLIFPLDVDAVDPASNRQVTTKFSLPIPQTNALNNQPYFASFPFPQIIPAGTSTPASLNSTGYDNYTFVATQPTQNPRLNHPLLSQKLRTFGDDLPFGDDNMYYLLAGDYRKSSIYSVIPNNLGFDPNSYSTALGLRNRQLITTRSYDLDFPGAPPWVTSSAASSYQFTPLAGSLTPGVVNASNFPKGMPMVTPAPGQMGNVGVQAAASNDYSDFKPNDGRANLLSKVDLNRKLTPYNDANGKFNGGLPIPTPVPPSALIPGLLAIHPEYRYYVATNDRQQFALDIFNRLVQATGAASMGRVRAGTASQPELTAIRWLAQLAVNTVDFIDDDDIITPFVWNPIDPKDPNNQANFAPDQISQRVVFGVEAPKLVVNEAYCELQNDPMDTTAAISGAKLPFQYSFWLEFYNPMSVATPGTAYTNKPPNMNLPPADRQDPNKGNQDRLAVQLQRANPTTNTTYPVYQVQIVDEAQSPTTFLAQPTNMDGSVNPAGIKIQVTSYMPDFAALAAGAPTPYPDYTFVQPNIGMFNIPTTSGSTTPSNTGFYVMGPDSKHPFVEQQPGGGLALHPTINLQDQGNTPPITSVPWGQPNDPTTGGPGTAKNAMTYQYQGPIQMTHPETMAQRKHTVLLRRLACPNLDPNPINPQTKTLVDPSKPYNPYVTVDYLTGVPTYDAVQYTSQGPAPFNKNQNFVQANQRYSIGRVQPYNAAVTKLASQTATANPVRNTFFQHNSPTPPPPSSASTDTSNQPNGPTLDYPFDWLTFADRPLTNVTEVLNVPSTAPHLLTHAFGFNQTTKQRDLTNHLAPWTIQDARIYRALEYFTVGDRSPYPGTLGRVAGKIDLNAIFDADTLNALIDAQPNSNFFTQQAVVDVWQGKLANPANPNDPANLSDPNNNSFRNRKQQLLSLQGASLPDRPFMSLAAPVVAANADPQYPNTAFPAGVGIKNTIAPYPIAGAAAGGPSTPGGTFMPQTANTTQPSANPPPSIIYPNPPPATPPTTPPTIPPYVLNELLTKVSGNTTVRSNTFAVFLTVGFFEVIDDTTLPVKLGAEVTTSTGKNIRHQMFAIVDRTNLAIDAGVALDPFTPDPTGRLRQAPIPPTFMSLGDGIAAGAGAPPAANKPATPLTVGVAGGLPVAAGTLPTMASSLPIDYDGTTPITFSPYQPGPTKPLNSPRGTYWMSGTCQWMFLDMGPTQEPVQVTLDQSGTKLQLLFPNGAQFNHPPGAMLCTYQPGNPGPQGPIDYASPQYRAVVPYTYIIQ